MKKVNTDIIKFFDTLADETRLNILVKISNGPTTVNEIHKALGENNITLSAISHQLTMMSNLNIVKSEKKGRQKYFRLSHDFCWCILKDAFGYFSKKKKCTHCANIENEGGLQ